MPPFEHLKFLVLNHDVCWWVEKRESVEVEDTTTSAERIAKE